MKLLGKAIVEAEEAADKAHADAARIWNEPLTTNDPAITAALMAIAAELRLMRLYSLTRDS